MLRVRALTIGALAALTLTAVAVVDTVKAADDYFQGKVIELILPNSPTGRMSRYANLYAPYIKKYTGADDVRVVGMQGGGGIKGTNYLWFQEPDGLSIAFTSIPTLILAQLSGSEAVQFDATKFEYLGRAATEPRMLVVGGNSEIKSIQDVLDLDREFVFPSQGTDEDFYTMAILADALGYDMKIVTGYEGMNDTALAVIKGDGDGQIGGAASFVSAIEAGDMRPILTVWGERLEEFPDVPDALELVDGDAKEAVQGIINMLTMHRGFYAPPDTDPEAVRILREAITKASNDPELIEGAKAGNLILLPSPGEEEQKKIEQITAASQSMVPVLKGALESIQ
jgi:tripartite-type tricarboxylate transporter receptor subunit TctC